MRQAIQNKINPAMIIFIMIIAGFTVSDNIDFYYFFPDSSQSNLGNLKKGMDAFFARKNAVVGFQPFLRFSDFSQKLEEDNPEFFLVPEWHFQSFKGEKKLKPILIPSRQGRTYYNKILVVKNNSGVNLKNIKEKTLAMTNMGPDTDRILNEILFSGYKTDAREVKKIVVPKDSDAIFALALGQVDMAFVVSGNLKKIRDNYPMIAENLTPLITSKPLKMPVLCCFEKNVRPEYVEKMKQLFLSGEKLKELAEVEEMLDIDGWLPYEKAMEKHL